MLYIPVLPTRISKHNHVYDRSLDSFWSCWSINRLLDSYWLLESLATRFTGYKGCIPSTVRFGSDQEYLLLLNRLPLSLFDLFRLRLPVLLLEHPQRVAESVDESVHGLTLPPMKLEVRRWA